MTTDDWLIHEHSLYENLLVECQDSVEMEDWHTVDAQFSELITHLKRHMALEEQVLYPAYEAATHAPQGPTTALREDHDHIVRLVQDMHLILQARNSDHALESLVHLEKEMIKHHEKEEDIFLPMASHILSARREDIERQFAAFDPSKTTRKWDL